MEEIGSTLGECVCVCSHFMKKKKSNEKNLHHFRHMHMPIMSICCFAHLLSPPHSTWFTPNGIFVGIDFCWFPSLIRRAFLNDNHNNLLLYALCIDTNSISKLYHTQCAERSGAEWMGLDIKIKLIISLSNDVCCEKKKHRERESEKNT